MRTALVVGGTGLVGGHLIARLVAEEEWPRVISLARRRAGRPGVEERLIDFERLDEAGPLDADDVFCALGTTRKKAGSREAFRRVDLDYVAGVAQAAYAAGTTQFLMVSSIGADPAAHNFYLSVKGMAEEVVSKVGFDCVQIFRPSLLLGERLDDRPLERWSMWGARLVRPLMAGPLERYRAVPASTVAAAMVTAARRPRPGVHVYRHPEMRELLSSESD